MTPHQVFAGQAARYDAWYREPAGRAVLRAEARMLDAALPKGVGADVGAGTCVFPPLLSNEREIICVEPVEEMLRVGAGRGSHALIAVAEKLPLRRLDFAYMVTVIEFVEDPVEAARGVAAALRPNGVAAVLFVESSSPWGRLYRAIAEEGSDPIIANMRLYTLEEVVRFFEEAGFRLSRVLSTLDYEPLTVPAEEPKIYEGVCERCGAVLAVFERLPRE